MRRDSIENNLRAQLADASEATSAEIEAQLTGPPFPKATAHVVEWWRKLAPDRVSTGFGLSRLTHRDVLARVELIGRGLTEFELDCLLQGDAAFVAEVTAESGKGGADYDPLRATRALMQELRAMDWITDTDTHEG